MGILDRFLGHSTTVAVFRGEALTSGEEFNSYENRVFRYRLFESLVGGSAYDRYYSWSHAMKAYYGLYKYIRPIYNPAHRLVEFYRSIIWGGALDLHRVYDGAIPIRFGIQDSELENRMRACIALILRDSNFGVMKGVVSHYGAMYGDVGIRIVDDPRKRRVTLEVVNPADIVSVERDSAGHIKGYVIERKVGDSLYREEATRVAGSDNVHYATYKDGELYAWNGTAAEWDEAYGFVPFVLIQHNNVGGEWGWSEIYPGLRKFMELDDIASKLHDQVRKLVDPVWMANFSAADWRRPGAKKWVRYKEETPSTAYSQPEREDVPIIFVGKSDAVLKPLVADVPVGDTVGAISLIISQLERDYPELSAEFWRIERDVSGAALSQARKLVERKVSDRRANYDVGLVHALQMALSIGAMRGYEAYSGIPRDAYERGLMDFWVDGNRPIFDVDEEAKVSTKLRMWQAVATGASVVPPEVVLKDMGWDREKVDEVVNQRLAMVSVGEEL